MIAAPRQPAMLPGRYLQLRRQASGLTIEQVAVRIAPRPSRWHETAAAPAPRGSSRSIPPPPPANAPPWPICAAASTPAA